MPEGTGQRFLVATGVTTGLQETAGRLERSVGTIADIFRDTFGYKRFEGLGLNPTAQEMRDELRALAKKCSPDDIVVLYHTGHGQMVAAAHRLWMGNTHDPPADTLRTADLAELMLAETPVRNLLLILDTCWGGQAVPDVMKAAIQAAGDFVGKKVLAITSAYPKERVQAGDFAHLLERSVNHPSTGGSKAPYLSLEAIVSHINKDPERRKWQTVSYSTVLDTGEAPFFPNPRHNTSYNFDPAAQREMEQAKRGREDLAKFFYPRARGVDVPAELGWYFVGRHAVLRDLTAWLTDQEDRRTIVVTGAPGSGKSAVIGRLAILSDPGWRRTVPRQGLPADTIPPAGSIDVAILARNRTSEEIFQRLCAAADLGGAANPGDFLRALGGRPMVVAIDAIDEAVDLDRLVSAVLNPLIEAGPAAGLRMLLGTRSYILDRDLNRLSPAAHRIDLDKDYADPESLRRYAEDRLRAAGRPPYSTADPMIVQAVARAVAQAAGRSFLVALITCRTLAAQREIPDPADEGWRASLPGTAAQAMQQDLVTRLGGDAARACALLRPLAYAAGRGLPWPDVWAPLASVLAGREYQDDDLMWLRENAGSYVIEDVEDGVSVYHLYHAALAEYLRHGEDDRQRHGEIHEFLLGRVPRAASGERNWPAADPYTLAHLATHGAAAGKLDKLIIDPGYLACAALLGLLAAFPAARDPDARLAAVAYQRAMHRLPSSDLPDRLSYLELAARRASATALAERIAAYPGRRRWSVSWIHWPPDHPHRVLAGHEGPVREVVGVTAGGQGARAASVGDDGTLRTWDLDAAGAGGVHEVSRTALAAIDMVELPGPMKLAVVLSAAGVLTAHELPSMSDTRIIGAHSDFWAAALQPLQLSSPEIRCVRLPDGTWAAITGGPGMVTSIWDIRTGRLIVRLSAGIRPARLEFRELASGVPVIVSADRRPGAEQVFDLATGRHIPDIRPPFRITGFAYYCREDGTPVLGAENRARIRAGLPKLFDLTGPPGGPVAVRGTQAGSPVQLADGSRISLVYDRPKRSWWPDADPPASHALMRLYATGQDPESGAAPDTHHPRHARPSDRFPFVVTLDGRILTLTPAPAATGRETITLTGHGANVTDADVVAMPGRPAALLSSSIDGTVRLWDITSDVQATPRGQVGDRPHAVVSTLTHQGQTLGVAVTATWDDNAAILDLGTGDLVARLGPPSGAIMAAACGWVPGAGHAVVAFDPGGARIWRLPGGDPVIAFQTYLPTYDIYLDAYLRGPTDRLPIQAAYVPLPGRPLAVTCGHGNKAVVWDLAGRRIHAVLGRHTGRISALACGTARDGTLLAVTGGHDNRVNIWNVARGRRAGHFRIAGRMAHLRRRDSGRAISVNLVTTRDRAVVLVLCADGKLRIFQKRRWRPGYQRASLDASGASSLAVLRLTDGRSVAMTARHDGRLCAWDLDAALAAIGSGENHTAALITIETEVTITGLSAGTEDTVVLSTLNGLAAFRLHPECLPGRAV
jgi:WD40 repeat protein